MGIKGGVLEIMQERLQTFNSRAVTREVRRLFQYIIPRTGTNDCLRKYLLELSKTLKGLPLKRDRIGETRKDLE